MKSPAAMERDAALCRKLFRELNSLRPAPTKSTNSSSISHEATEMHSNREKHHGKRADTFRDEPCSAVIVWMKKMEWSAMFAMASSTPRACRSTSVSKVPRPAVNGSVWSAERTLTPVSNLERSVAFVSQTQKMAVGGADAAAWHNWPV